MVDSISIKRIIIGIIATLFSILQLSLSGLLLGSASAMPNENANAKALANAPVSPGGSAAATASSSPGPVSLPPVASTVAQQQVGPPSAAVSLTASAFAPAKSVVTLPAAANQQAAENVNKVLPAQVSPAVHSQPQHDPKVTLCHATASTKNPFVKINVAAAGAYNGHLGAPHQDEEDVIPPFTFRGHSAQQNWNANGQATFNNGCAVPSGGSGGGSGGGNPIVTASVNLPTSQSKSPVVLHAAAGTEELANTGSNSLVSLAMAIALIVMTISLATPIRNYQS
jgi:hypothetical protein